ncbi:MAG: NAD(P)/FAD-dependent oxidoreductase [Pseudomonadota bacterium]
MTDTADVIIVGAGHNGLTCAAYLARAGMQVICLESAPQPGGLSAKRSFGEHYRLPGLAHWSYPLSPTLCRELELERFGYVPGKPADTVVLDRSAGPLTLGGNSVSGESLSRQDAAEYPRFRDQYLEFAKVLRPVLKNRPPRLKDSDSRDKRTLARLGWDLRFGLGRDKMGEFLRVAGMNIFDLLNDTFSDERLKAAIAVDAVMGNGMGPRTPGSVLTWLTRLAAELNGGPVLYDGGTSDIVAPLTQSAQSAGATIRCDARVERIVVENGRAGGVVLENGERLTAACIVSSADPRTTFLSLVGAPRLDAMFARRVAQIRGAGVVAKLHLGLDGLPAFDGVEASQPDRRFLIGPSMRYVERAFNPVKYGEYSDEPVLEITLPSVNNPDLAPAGQHVMSVNVAYIPYKLKAGWESGKTALFDTLIALLERYAPGLRSQIVAHECLTPADIEAGYLAGEGHWHHGELALHQSLMLRPVHGAAQYDTPVENLYLCGAGCHPGGDLTGLPGQNAAWRILETDVSR